MAGNLQPLDQWMRIVKLDGTPTPEFIRWAQTRQIDIGQAIDAQQALQIIQDFLAANPLVEGSGINLSPSGNIADGVTISAEVQEILDQISSTRGTVLFRGATDWQGLAPGTAGQFLKTNGAGADPEWSASGGGGWTVVGTWNYSTPVNAIPFIGLSGYKDFLVLARNITFASNSAASVRVSVDNGSTYFSTSGNYLSVAATGITTAGTHIGSFANALHTATRDGFVEIIGNTGSNAPISRSSAQLEVFREFVASALPINALQVFSNNTGSPNFSGGSIVILAR